MFVIIKNKVTGYPKWLHLVSEFPFEEEFEFYPEECKYDYDLESFSFSVTSPTTAHIHGGIMADYTDTPNSNNLFYSGCGCTCQVDSDGKRFIKLDKSTGDLYRKKQVLNYRIIRNYIVNKKQIIRKKKLENLLDE